MKNFGTGVRDTAQQGVMNVAGLFPGGQEATLKTQIGVMNLFGIDSNDLSQQQISWLPRECKMLVQNQEKLKRNL